MSEYLRKNFEVDSEGDLEITTIISQMLVSESRKYQDEFINCNLVDNIDGLAETSLYSSSLDENQKICANIYPGLYHYDNNDDTVSEKILETTSIKISLDQNEKQSLTITPNDIKTLKKSKVNGAFGTIYFLDESKLECDSAANREFKTKLVIKRQERRFDMGVTIGGKDRCLAFNELVNFQTLKLGDIMNASKCQDTFSDLYITHFYVPRASDKKSREKFDLFIVMKRCELILTELIERVHGAEFIRRRDLNPTRKFPVVLLKNLVYTFIVRDGSIHATGSDLRGCFSRHSFSS